MKREVILLLGSNLGNRDSNLFRARTELEVHFQKIQNSSSIYESEAWGFNSNNPFLNQVVTIQTEELPQQVLEIVLGIETKLGRIRDKKSNTYESRKIDIDILFIDDLIIHTPALEVPHSQLHNRKFTLVALAELDEKLVHPVYKQSISQLLLKCKDNLWVKKYISK